MRIQKTELAAKLNKIKGVVPKKTTLPALQGILVKEGYLIANNMEMAVKAKIEGAEDETFIIPMKAFDLIGNLPDGEVEISADKNDVITIKTEMIKNTYKTMSPDSFPISWVQGSEENEITINSDVLLESMKHVSYAIPSQSGNMVMTAMCLQAAEKELNFVGLDGHVLAWDKIEYEGDFELLIPKSTVEKLLTIGLSGDVSIHHNKQGAVFITDEYEVYTRLIEGNYFKYKDMFREFPSRTSVIRGELLNAMVRAKMCTEERCPVHFDFAGNVLNISIKDNVTYYHETINLQESIKNDFTIGFNARLVLETLKAFDCEKVNMQFSGSKQPMIVESEGSCFKAVVLPVALI